MSGKWCLAIQAGVRLAVQVTPNAKKSEVIGVLDDALKIKLQAQPIDGKANEALIRFLAERLNVPKRALALTHGHTSRLKLIEINSPGMTPEHVVQALLAVTN